MAQKAGSVGKKVRPVEEGAEGAKSAEEGVKKSAEEVTGEHSRKFLL